MMSQYAPKCSRARKGHNGTQENGMTKIITRAQNSIIIDLEEN